MFLDQLIMTEGAKCTSGGDSRGMQVNPAAVGENKRKKK